MIDDDIANIVLDASLYGTLEGFNYFFINERKTASPVSNCRKGGKGHL
ncbi:hypothetical protein GCM10008933_39070 [Paenibacillus motobuensis]|uniref:Uncharacterized protein n=1 Tax=Paenibacillus motobuensis TaxID=295324 RepID=A0ABN0YR50_9BACL